MARLLPKFVRRFAPGGNVRLSVVEHAELTLLHSGCPAARDNNNNNIHRRTLLYRTPELPSGIVAIAEKPKSSPTLIMRRRIKAVSATYSCRVQLHSERQLARQSSIGGTLA